MENAACFPPFPTVQIIALVNTQPAARSSFTSSPVLHRDFGNVNSKNPLNSPNAPDKSQAGNLWADRTSIALISVVPIYFAAGKLMLHAWRDATPGMAPHLHTEVSANQQANPHAL